LQDDLQINADNFGARAVHDAGASVVVTSDYAVADCEGSCARGERFVAESAVSVQSLACQRVELRDVGTPAGDHDGVVAIGSVRVAPGLSLVLAELAEGVAIPNVRLERGRSRRPRAGRR
jgi:hypothetical protein